MHLTGKMSLSVLRQFFFQIKDDVFEHFDYGIGDTKALEGILKSFNWSSQPLEAVQHPRYVSQSCYIELI